MAGVIKIALSSYNNNTLILRHISVKLKKNEKWI